MTSMATRLRRALRHAKVRFYALIARTSIRMPTCRAQTTPDAVPLPIASACAKCGTSTKSGKSSCCSPGGDWFGDCADEVDENHDHTWAEGIKACRCKFHKHHCRGENASVRLYAQILTHHSPTQYYRTCLSRHRSAVHVLSAARSRVPATLVVVLLEAIGSEIVEVREISPPITVTRGQRASRCASTLMEWTLLSINKAMRMSYTWRPSRWTQGFVRATC